MRSRLAQRDRNGCGFQKCLLEFDCGGDSCKKVAKVGTPRRGGGLPLDAEEGDGSAESRGDRFVARARRRHESVATQGIGRYPAMNAPVLGERVYVASG